MPPLLLHLMFMQILFPGSKSAPYMSLRLICIQNDPCLSRQHRSDPYKSLRYIFVDRRFTYPHLVRRLPDRRSGVNDIICCFYRPFFYVSLQRKSPRIFCFYSLCRDPLRYDRMFKRDSLLNHLFYLIFGNLTINLDPISALDMTCIVPPCASTIHLAIDSPRPEPPVSPFLASSER